MPRLEFVAGSIKHLAYDVDVVVAGGSLAVVEAVIAAAEEGPACF